MGKVTYVIQILITDKEGTGVDREYQYYVDDNCFGNYSFLRSKAHHFLYLKDAKKKLNQLKKYLREGKEGPLKIIKVTWEEV